MRERAPPVAIRRTYSESSGLGALESEPERFSYTAESALLSALISYGKTVVEVPIN